MIIEKQKEAKILSYSKNKETVKMSLDLESTEFLMAMLSKNLYSDPIGSTIRETTCNALDSHRKIKSKKPVIVSFLKNEENNYEFTVEDFGISLDDKDVNNIISKYGKSTKRNDAKAIGCMGIGFKSPLAYSSVFYFICRKNNIERKYMMYEDEESNSIDLLYETSTENCNGVKIIVPVNYSDKHLFFAKIKEQLCYFENVYFNISNLGFSNLTTITDIDKLNNNFQIIRHDDFQISELNYNEYLHICLDDVVYSIDFDKLGIKPIKTKLALRFSLSDGIYPNPARETLRYTEEAKQIILNKIKKVATFCVLEYNKKFKEENDVLLTYTHYNKKYLREINLNNKTLDILDIIDYSDQSIISPKLKNIFNLNLNKIFNLGKSILSEYQPVLKFDKNTFSSKINNSQNCLSIHSALNEIFICSETITVHKKNYLKEYYCKNNNFNYIHKKTKNFKLKERFSLNYYEILNLKDIPKENWRNLIIEFQLLQKYFIDLMINVDKIEIPKQWIESKKIKKNLIAKERIKKLKGEVSFKKAVNLKNNIYDKYCKFIPDSMLLDEIHKNKEIIVYGLEENKDLLDKLYGITANNITYIYLTKNEYKKIENLKIHNLIKIENFMEGKNMPFKRIVTSYLINKLYNKHRSVFNNIDLINNISSDLHDKIKILLDYKFKYYINGSEEIFTILLQTAKNNNLFDTKIYNEYLELNEFLNKYEFFNILLNKISRYSYDDDPLFGVLIDVCKYHKIKLNLDKYNTINNKNN